MQIKPFNHLASTTGLANILVLLSTVLFTLAACATKTPPPPPQVSTSTAVQEGVPGGITVNSVVANSSTEVVANITISLTTDLGPRDVTVSSPKGSAELVGAFSVTISDVKVTGVTPPSGKRGDTMGVTIAGLNFENVDEITFGAGITVTTFTVVSGTEISATITIAEITALGTRNVGSVEGQPRA